jgi:hypothetical protein
MSFHKDQFNAVVGILVLHHLDINKGFSEIFRIHKPVGIICFSEPNMINSKLQFKRM